MSTLPDRVFASFQGLLPDRRCRSPRVLAMDSASRWSKGLSCQPSLDPMLTRVPSYFSCWGTRSKNWKGKIRLPQVWYSRTAGHCTIAKYTCIYGSKAPIPKESSALCKIENWLKRASKCRSRPHARPTTTSKACKWLEARLQTSNTARYEAWIEWLRWAQQPWTPLFASGSV